MRKIICTTVAVLACIFSFAQNVERIAVKGSDLPLFYEKEEFKYPKFISTRVYLKNGDTAVGKFNFDFFDQSMHFINQKGDTVTLANEKDVKYITVGTDSFFYENGYYEWMATSAKARLAVKHTFKLAERQNLGAYGLSSPTMNVQTIGKIFSGGKSVDLPPNEELVFTRETTYYISLLKGPKNNFVVANKNNISDLFPKKDVEDFIKENKLNLNKEEDLIDLFIYISKPN